MNYYNPYFIPASSNLGFSSLFGRGFNFSSILNGAQRALGLFNQALPLIKEAAPIMKNAKTMFRVMNEFKKIDASNNSISSDVGYKRNDIKDKPVFNNGGPTFFA